MKQFVTVHDCDGHEYLGVEIKVYNNCNCSKDLKDLGGKPYHEDDLIWYDKNYTYRLGSCIGQKICCKHCNKLIGIAVSEAALQIGVTRNGLGEEYSENKNYHLPLYKEVKRTHFSILSQIKNTFKR